MENKNNNMRPYLKRTGGRIEEVMCFYPGPVPFWMFEYFNARICYHAGVEQKMVNCPYDIMECYQQAQEESSLEKILFVTEEKAKKEKKSMESLKGYIKYAIQSLCDAYYTKKNKELDHVSLDVEQYGNVAFTTDKHSDERDKDSSTVLERTMAKLTAHEIKLFAQVKMGKTSEETAKDLGIPRQTYEWQLDQACWRFLGNLGLEKVRHLIHDEKVQKLLDALTASKGNIAIAAKMLNITRNDCRNAFKFILIPALLKACGGHEALLEFCY